MATTNHTANYNLPQWVASDKVGIMANLNPAFSTIDEKLHEAVVNAENAAATSSAANQVATNASNQVNNANSDITALQANVLTLQNLVNSINRSLTNAATWTKVPFTYNTTIIAGNYLNCTIRNDKQFISIYGVLTMNKINLTGDEVILTLQSNIPTTQRDIISFGFIRYSINNNAVDVSVRCRVNTDGTIVIANQYDFSASEIEPTMFCQLLLNTQDWYN